MSSIGINFRQSSNYVTDGAGETYCLGEVYPITRGGRTFGWSADVTANSRNRSTSVDRRLSGINGVVNTAAKATFTLDLPAPGNYRIRAAFGDQGSSQNILAVIKDGTTTKATINTQPSGGNWTDAAGVSRTSSAVWVSNNQSIDINFSGTKLNIELGGHSTATFSSVISHLYVEALDAGDPPSGTVTISGVTPSSTSAVVTYSYSTADQTGFEYRLNSGTASTIGTSPATISGLTASTSYNLEVRAINAEGAGAWSAVTPFTTTSAGDTTPPTLTGTISITSLTTASYTATWPAGTDNVGVTGYEYQINSGGWIDVGNVLTANISGRTPGSTDTFQVRAYDAANNRSTPALSQSVILNSLSSLTTSILMNNTGTVHSNTSVYWSWLPSGRIGSLTSITPSDGTGTTDSNGQLTVTGLATPGILLVTKRNTSATDDDVYYEAFD